MGGSGGRPPEASPVPPTNGKEGSRTAHSRPMAVDDLPAPPLAWGRGDVKSSCHHQQSCSARMTAKDVQGRATRGRVCSAIGEGAAATWGTSIGRCVGPPPYLGGPMEQVILVLGQLALILAGVVCVVGFALLIISMALAALRKLLEFRRCDGP